MRAVSAANDEYLRGAPPWEQDDYVGFKVPDGHVGPIVLSETGRTVWWTGRVAIGLRYRAPHRGECHGQSALWIQSLLID